MLNRIRRWLVVYFAKSQVGNSDALKYWESAGAPTLLGKAWCGAFALWALHKAGVARNVLWQTGSGFLSHFPTTNNPQPGDIAYFNQYQHEAVVSSVTTSTVSLINGNGTGGKVTISTVPRSTVTAFYNVIG